MIKHTPGPWHVVESTLEVHAKNRAICELCTYASQKKELANARLIAAAPDLLRVLVQLEQACADEGVQGMDSLLAAARAAIAKATKKEECADEDGDVMCSACNCWKATRANCS